MGVSRCAVFYGPGKDLELTEVSCPTPGEGEILVRVLGCTLCGSDVHTVSGRRETPVPTILGHEIVGEIEAMGSGAPTADIAGRELRVGDRITWSIVASCGTCFYCCRDLPQKCLSMVKYGHEAMRPGRELLGGLAEHCLLVPGTAIVRLPESLPLSVACPASCATATVAAALAAAGVVRDRTACIFGAGMLGLTATAMARAEGATEIVSVDIDENRVAHAMGFGATHAVAPENLPDACAATTENRGFDVVVEVSGSPSAFQSAWDSLRIGGTLVLVGSVFPAPPVALNLEQVVRRNVTIRGIHNYAARDLLTAVDFLEASYNVFPFSELVDSWYLLDEVTQAFDASHDPHRIRVGVRPR